MGTHRKGYLEVSLEKMPDLLKPFDKINLEELKSKLDLVEGNSPSWEENRQAIIVWPTVVGLLLVILLIVVIWWWLKR